MTRGIRNPAKLPTDLNPAEEKFVDSLAEGKPCIIGNEGFSTSRPEEGIKFGDNANVVRGEVIRFFAYGGNEKNPVLGPAIHLQGAWIYGEESPLDLTHADIRYVLRFFHCHFVDRVGMADLKCPALYMSGSRLAKGLQAGEMRTDGPVHLRNSFVADEQVDLSRAHIGGDLDCTRGRFNDPNGKALIANHVTVKGEMFLRKDFSATGEVRMLNARIAGDFDCRRGRFDNLGGNALSADGMVVGGTVFLNKGFSAEGQVKLPYARIGGNLDCTGGEFRNPKKDALSASGVTVGSNMFLRKGFAADGLVNILGANIGGNLDCAGGCFYNAGQYALNAERVVTGGHVFLNKHVSGGNQPFSAHGRVRFANADIGRNFNCKGGQFSHLGEGSAIAAAGLWIRGAVFLSEGFTIQGNVALNAARIEGNFVCKKCGLAEGIIDLSSTKVSAVDDDCDSWKKFEFILDGFTYENFYGESPRSSKRRLCWLSKRPNTRSFSPLPYEQAAKALRAMGKGIDAWDIEKEKRRLERVVRKDKNDFEIPIWRRWWGRTIDVLTDFVYRPWKTFGLAFAIVCVSAFLFNYAVHRNQIIPHHPAILASAKYQEAREKHPPMEAARIAFPDESPEFTPLVFALDVFIPLSALYQESFWAPASNKNDDWWKSSILLVLLLTVLAAFARLAWWFQNRIKSKWGGNFGPIWAGGVMALLVFVLGYIFVAGIACVFWDFQIGLWLRDWRWLTVWYWLEIGLGWILTSLFLLSVTGLLRLRQSSGEKD